MDAFCYDRKKTKWNNNVESEYNDKDYQESDAEVDDGETIDMID